MKKSVLIVLVLIAFGLSLHNSADSVCGNGVIEAGERCDDGNLINNDEYVGMYEIVVGKDGRIINFTFYRYFDGDGY